MSRPEQPVIDEIDRLVSWQIEEGQRRGDGPECRDFMEAPPAALEFPRQPVFPMSPARYALLRSLGMPPRDAEVRP